MVALCFAIVAFSINVALCLAIVAFSINLFSMSGVGSVYNYDDDNDNADMMMMYVRMYVYVFYMHVVKLCIMFLLELLKMLKDKLPANNN